MLKHFCMEENSRGHYLILFFFFCLLVQNFLKKLMIPGCMWSGNQDLKSSLDYPQAVIIPIP